MLCRLAVDFQLEVVPCRIRMPKPSRGPGVGPRFWASEKVGWGSVGRPPAELFPELEPCRFSYAVSSIPALPGREWRLGMVSGGGRASASRAETLNYSLPSEALFSL